LFEKKYNNVKILEQHLFARSASPEAPRVGHLQPNVHQPLIQGA